MQANLIMQQDVKCLILAPILRLSRLRAIIKRHQTTTICLPTYNEGDERRSCLRLPLRVRLHFLPGRAEYRLRLVHSKRLGERQRQSKSNYSGPFRRRT